MNKLEIDIVSHFKNRNYFDAEPHVLRFLPDSSTFIFSFVDAGEMLSGVLGLDKPLPFLYRIVTLVFQGVTKFSHLEYQLELAGSEAGNFLSIGPDAAYYMMNFIKVKMQGNCYECEMDFERGLGNVSFSFKEVGYYQNVIYKTDKRGEVFIGAIDPDFKKWIPIDEYFQAIADDYAAVITGYSQDR